MADEKTIDQLVKEIIVEQLSVSEEEVVPEDSIVDDKRADSLDLVELIMVFEEKFGQEIPDDAAEKIQTVKDAIDYIKTHMKK
jgi:acyl carrier protein